MEFGDAIDMVATHRRKMGHAHIAFAAFVNQGEAGKPVAVLREPATYLVQEATIDFIDDLQVARQ